MDQQEDDLEVRFDRFMQAALYDPERGYYTSRIQSVGSRGDFTTTPQLSQSLAKAIAQCYLASGSRHLIEVGPGTGVLARSIWKHLPFLAKRRTEHHLVEVSEPLRKHQKREVPHAHLHCDIKQALASAKGDAFVYSNELVDAFPVRIFRREVEGWTELFLTGKAGALKESFRPTSELPDSLLFEAEEHSVQQRVEIHESYHHWLQEWLPLLIKGQFLTIDYVAPALRPLGGTLRGYFLHNCITRGDLYQNAGHLDLTTDVHFDDLERWGQPLGLETLSRQRQNQFLAPYVNLSPSDQFVTNPEGAGEAFEVLLQRKI